MCEFMLRFFNSTMKCANVVILTGVITTLVSCGDTAYCNVTGNSGNLGEFNDTTGASLRKKGVLTCPGRGDPSDYTECCWDSRFQCCPSPHRPIMQIDDRLVMTVGLTVICSCLMLTVAVVVCCFWGRCPLYSTCRVNYTQGDIIAYAKEDDPLTGSMPPEDKGGHQYAPNAVKIKPVEDV